MQVSPSIDCKTPDLWNYNDLCDYCNSLFTLSSRRHHCRKCHVSVCNDCTEKAEGELLTIPVISTAGAILRLEIFHYDVFVQRSYSTKDKLLEIVDISLTDLPNANLRYHVMPLSTIIMMISLTVGIDVNTTIKRECHDWSMRACPNQNSRSSWHRYLTATTEATLTWQKALDYSMDEIIILVNALLDWAESQLCGSFVLSWHSCIARLVLVSSCGVDAIPSSFCFIGVGVCFGRFAASRNENIICMCIGLKYLKRTQNKPIITCPVKVDALSCKLCLHVKNFSRTFDSPLAEG